MNITVEICTLCEQAEIDDGSLWIERSFDTIYADQFPTEVSSIWVALRIQFHEVLSRSGLLHFHFDSPDGLPVVVIPVCVSKNGPTQPGKADSFCINLTDFTLPESGVYSAKIFAKDKCLISMPVCVKQSRENQVTVPGIALN